MRPPGIRAIQDFAGSLALAFGFEDIEIEKD